jgi:demethylmenaquinone methyltransferase/2-methoxy-6-polyprenyl-1,4-benzoquinol methylase
MANTFYDPGEQRSARVNALFAKIARRYDLVNDVQSLGLHRRWKNRVAAMAAARHGDRVLDCCCGTGDISFALARRGAAVVGLDFSDEMLGIAHARSQGVAPGLQNSQLTFVRGDAQQLPFVENTFDAVTVGYGLRNLADPMKGIAEMQRVAKPGGRLVILEFGKPGNTIWRACYLGHLKLFVPLLGLIFYRNASAYRYIVESLSHYPSQVELAEKMRDRGLANVTILNILGGAMSIHSAEKAQTG